jgi:hypothetical protein
MAVVAVVDREALAVLVQLAVMVVAPVGYVVVALAVMLITLVQVYLA